MPSVCEVVFYLFRSDGLAVVPSGVFAKVLSDGTIGLLVDLRIGGVSPVKFFAKLFYKKGLSRRHDWVTCNLTVECRKASRFFCQGLSRRHR